MHILHLHTLLLSSCNFKKLDLSFQLYFLFVLRPMGGCLLSVDAIFYYHLSFFFILYHSIIKVFQLRNSTFILFSLSKKSCIHKPYGLILASSLQYR